MSYRIHEHPKPMPRRTMQDTATPMLIHVHNGATANLAVPCWYQEVRKPIRAVHHNHHYHDHAGWPSPNHPDHVCQLVHSKYDHREKCPIGHDHCGRDCRHYIDMRNIHPIHLLAEGYKKDGRVTFDDAPEGLLAYAEIDDREDWVVRVYFYPRIEDAIDKPVDCHFTVFIDSEETIDFSDESEDNEEQEESPATTGIAARTDVVAHGILRVLPSNYQ